MSHPESLPQAEQPVVAPRPFPGTQDGIDPSAGAYLEAAKIVAAAIERQTAELVAAADRQTDVLRYVLVDSNDETVVSALVRISEVVLKLTDLFERLTEFRWDPITSRERERRAQWMNDHWEELL